MARILTCVLCNGKVEEHPVTFIKQGKVWTVNVHLCKNEECVKKRGGYSTEYRIESRGKA